MLFLTLLSLSINDTSLVVKYAFKVPKDLYEIDAMVEEKGYFYLLDTKSGGLAVVDRQGEPLAIQMGKGAGPGEFSMPRALVVGDEVVYVSDMRKVLMFSSDGLKFLGQFHIDNNPRSLAFFNKELFVSMVSYPGGKNGIHVFNTAGKRLRKFLPVREEQSMKMPFINIDGQGTLYVLNRVHYELNVLNTRGEEVRKIRVKRPVLYREVVPIEPFDKKYGKTMASALRWRQAWSEPAGLAIVADRYLFVCFQELGEDLHTREYFIEVYDLSKNTKIVSWQKMKGPLLNGGSHAFFYEEDQSDDFTSPNRIVAYSMRAP